MEKFKNKKTLVMLAVILGSVALIGGGVAFAYFGIGVGGTGNTENNETEVTMVSLGSIYYNGETTFESTDMYPGDIGIQTFKIGPEEQSGIGTYEIDLESVLPDEFGTDIEITLYKTTAPDTNNVTVKDGALTTNNSEISRADELVVTGTPEVVYGPIALTADAITILEQAAFDTDTLEETTYYLVYNYKNEGDQNDQQGLTFGGTVTVRLIVGPVTLTERIMVDGEVVNNYPSKDSWATFESVKCAYGTQATWDEENWTMVYPEEVGDLCTVSFKSNLQVGTSYLANLAATDTTNLNTVDPDNNVRYMGANPNNYVEFNDELWRIIGIFNIDGEQRIKIIRANAIGQYSWDSSASSVNSGYGVNEWSQADIMKTLNTTYLTGGTGTCYGGSNNATKECIFGEESGQINPLSTEAQSYIDNATWYIGTNTKNWDATTTTDTPAVFYNYERNGLTTKLCSSGTTCNDSVARTGTWVGKVGLMYPSDYGYSSAGSGSHSHSVCVNAPMHFWRNSNGYNYSGCPGGSWLYDTANSTWTMNRVNYSSYAYAVFFIRPTGYLGNNTGDSGASSASVFPTVYLKSGISFAGGTGTETDPYQISL